MTVMLFQWGFMLFLLGFSDVQDSVALDRSMQSEDYIRIKWDDLAHVDFENKYNADFQQFMPYPVFHEKVQALNGKKVMISGYLIPLNDSPNESIRVLSANPFSSCFFCGAAGPETVMDVNAKGKLKDIDMDKRITLKGTFRLNANDLYALFYMLDDAQLVE